MVFHLPSFCELFYSPLFHGKLFFLVCRQEVIYPNLKENVNRKKLRKEPSAFSSQLLAIFFADC